MKIGEPSDLLLNPVLGTPALRRAETATAKAAGNAIKSSSPAIEWSKAASGADEQFDAEKVTSVSAAIKRGDYQVDAQALADKLLAIAQELLNRRSKIQSSSMLDSLGRGQP